LPVRAVRLPPRTYPLVAVFVLIAACLGPSPDDARDPTASSAATGVPGMFIGSAADGLPSYRTLPERIGRLTVAAYGDAPPGVRIRLWEDRAYVTTGNASDGVAIFDIQEPLEPKRLGSFAGIAPREGLGILDYGARTVVVASPAAGGISFIEVTEPSEPKELTRLEIPSHTLGVYRPGGVVYNGGWTDGEVGGLEIIDARDPDHIKVDKVWTWGERAADGTPIQPTGCHDIIVDQENARAYCAAQEQTTIWDLHDPFAPVVLTVVNNPAAPHHNTAFPILDGTVLVIGEELLGCGPDLAGKPTPTGLWFYDLKTTPPSPLGWVSVEETDPNEPGIYGICAPHFGSEIGQTGFLSFSWFNKGVVLVDARDPRSPKIVGYDNAGGEASDAVFYRGLVFIAGEQGGLQVAVPEPE
jgi:hypothetical protein